MSLQTIKVPLTAVGDAHLQRIIDEAIELERRALHTRREADQAYDKVVQYLNEYYSKKDEQ